MPAITNKGFSLLELLVTVAIIGIMSSLAVMQFKEYTQKTAEMTALQSCVDLRTSIQAGLADDHNETLYSEARTLKFSPTGAYSCESGCTGISRERAFPGFTAQRNIAITANFNDTLRNYNLNCGSCLSLNSAGTNFNGWLLNAFGSPQKAQIPVGSNAADCAAVANSSGSASSGSASSSSVSSGGDSSSASSGGGSSSMISSSESSSFSSSSGSSSSDSGSSSSCDPSLVVVYTEIGGVCYGSYGTGTCSSRAPELGGEWVADPVNCGGSSSSIDSGSSSGYSSSDSGYSSYDSGYSSSDSGYSSYDSGYSSSDSGYSSYDSGYSSSDSGYSSYDSGYSSSDSGYSSS